MSSHLVKRDGCWIVVRCANGATAHITDIKVIGPGPDPGTMCIFTGPATIHVTKETYAAIVKVLGLQTLDDVK